MALPQDNLPLNTTGAWNFDGTLVGVERSRRALEPGISGAMPDYTGAGPFAAACVTFNPAAGGYTGPLRALGAGVGVFGATDDFCIELWIKPIDGGHGDAYSRIVETKSIGALGGWNIVCLESQNPARVRLHRSDGSTLAETPDAIANGAWSYLRFYRQAGQIYLRVGESIVSGPLASTDAFSATDLAVGANLSGGERYLGSIGGLRITRGASRASEPVPMAVFPPAYEVGSAALVGPRAVADGFGYVEQRGAGELRQPLVVVSARGGAAAAMAQPRGQMQAIGGPAMLQGGAMVQPLQVLAGQGGALGALTQPRARLAGAGATDGVGEGQLRQPMPTISARAITGATGRGVLGQPTPTLVARGGGTGALVLPPAAVHGWGTAGAVGQAALRQPVSAISASGHGWFMGHGALVQPRARMVPAVIVALVQPMAVASGSGAPLADSAAARVAWCFTPTVDDEGRMGGALTRWPDYQGHAMARTASATWVTSPGATYKMGGEADGEQLVQWSWDTALADFDVSQKKVMVSAYIGGVVPTCTTYRVSAGDSPKHSYGHEEYALQLRNHRQKFGRGRKARYLGFGLSGAGPLSVDTVEFEIVSTTRRM